MPPPLIYAVPFLAGWLLHRSLPLPLAARDPQWLDALGVLFVAAWFVLFGWAFWTLVAQRTTVRPDRPTRVLVITGPYAFTRNPLYLALTLLYIGLTLIVNSWWPAVGLPVVLIIVQRYVIGREERYLRGLFGERYEAYRKRVRRWL